MCALRSHIVGCIVVGNLNHPAPCDGLVRALGSRLMKKPSGPEEAAYFEKVPSFCIHVFSSSRQNARAGKTYRGAVRVQCSPIATTACQSRRIASIPHNVIPPSCKCTFAHRRWPNEISLPLLGERRSQGQNTRSHKNGSKRNGYKDLRTYFSHRRPAKNDVPG